jgi:hypothetical protein
LHRLDTLPPEDPEESLSWYGLDSLEAFNLPRLGEDPGKGTPTTLKCPWGFVKSINLNLFGILRSCLGRGQKLPGLGASGQGIVRLVMMIIIIMMSRLTEVA